MPEAYEVVVCGGGPSGVPAAVQAARAGARTLLLEKTSRLGGVTVNAGIDRPGLFHAWGRQVIAGIGWDLVCRAIETGGGTHADYNNSQASPFSHAPEVDQLGFACACDHAVLHSGADLLLHALPASVTWDPEARSWLLQVALKEGLASLRAQVIIDATGDANLAAMAGAPLRLPTVVQPATLNFSFDGFDPATVDMAALNQAFLAAVEAGELKASDGSWHADPPSLNRMLGWKGRNGNHLPALPEARTSQGRTSLEVEGRAAVLRFLRFLRRQPGFGGVAIRYVSPEVGVRETVTIEGEVTVSIEDYLSGRLWEDAVCYAYYPVDLHGLDRTESRGQMLAQGVVPSIPRRALLPRNTRNLLVAGRTLSSDRLANSALRVQAPCMAMGQAAGAWAALAAQSHRELREVPNSDLRALLQEHGAIVPPGKA